MHSDQSYLENCASKFFLSLFKKKSVTRRMATVFALVNTFVFSRY